MPLLLIKHKESMEMKKVIDYVYDVILGRIVIVLGITMSITVIIQIAARYLPFTAIWTEEVSRLLFLWFSFIGAVVTLKYKMHLGIDYFYNKMGIRSKKLSDILVYVLILSTTVVLCVYGLRLVKLVSIQSSPVFGISMVFFYLPVAVFGFFSSLITAYELFLYVIGKEQNSASLSEAEILGL